MTPSLPGPQHEFVDVLLCRRELAVDGVGAGDIRRVRGSISIFCLEGNPGIKKNVCSPVTKANIVLGESLGRVFFQLLIVIVLILFGKYAYIFTLAHGLVTVLELLVLSTLALIVFMGFGFFISSVAKNQNVIPIYANLFMFPQYFLGGTFFPKTVLPKSIHWLIEALPLTALNDALRKVAFEGSHLNDCWNRSAF